MGGVLKRGVWKGYRREGYGKGTEERGMEEIRKRETKRERDRHRARERER